MITVNDPSKGLTLTLTGEERSQLLSWLEQRLRDKLVEEHRTESVDFRKNVLHQEEILGKVIRKLRQG